MLQFFLVQEHSCLCHTFVRHKLRASLDAVQGEIALLPGRCPKRVKPCSALTCFQEVPPLTKEEVSIFRLMGPADGLSSFVASHLNSDPKVCVFFFFFYKRGSGDAFGHSSLFVHVFACASVLKMLFLTRELCTFRFC